MGYQVTFTPTEEAMEKYKPWQKEKPSHTDSLVTIMKYEIISYCMNNKEEMPSKVIKQLGFHLRSLQSAIEAEEKANAYFRWKEDKDHQLWYCGWEFSRDSQFNKEDLMQDYIERLFILANLVETPNYFTDHENFFTKYKDITEDVDAFIELIQDITIHNIIDDLDEFKVKYEEE